VYRELKKYLSESEAVTS